MADHLKPVALVPQPASGNLTKVSGEGIHMVDHTATREATVAEVAKKFLASLQELPSAVNPIFSS